MSSFLPTGSLLSFMMQALSRMCGIDRRVNELTFAELRQLSLVNTKEQIPSFQEALALVNGKVPLLVELKMEHLDFDIPRKADALLSEYSGDYCIESFHPAALYWYRKNPPADFPRAAFHQFQY